MEVNNLLEVPKDYSGDVITPSKTVISFRNGRIWDIKYPEKLRNLQYNKKSLIEQSQKDIIDNLKKGTLGKEIWT